MSDDRAADIRAAVDKMMRAQFEPTGLVLHPVDHAQVEYASGDQHDPERIKVMKNVCDAFGLPYWAAGIPGYRPPLRNRLRARWNLAVRRVRSLPGYLPGVTRYEPLDGWTPHYERRGPGWVRVGRWAIGSYHPEEDW